MPSFPSNHCTMDDTKASSQRIVQLPSIRPEEARRRNRNTSALRHLLVLSLVVVLWFLVKAFRNSQSQVPVIDSVAGKNFTTKSSLEWPWSSVRRIIESCLQLA